MLALCLDQVPKLISDYPEPKRRKGEALLRLRLAGICDTDLQLLRGYMQYRGVLGHEFVADVLEADDPTLIGQRVVSDINCGCGACRDCTELDGHHCRLRTVLGIAGRDGAFSERFVMPEHCLVSVPELVSDELAVFAEPLAAAIHVLQEIDADTVDRVIIIGDGKLGLLIGMVLSQTRLGVTQIGHHKEKLDWVSARGVHTQLEAAGIQQLQRAPLVIEASGSESGLDLAMRLVLPRGKVVLKTTTAAQHTLALARLVVDEISLVGSRCGDMTSAVEWLARGRVDPRGLISARYPLREADRALEHAARPGTMKVLISNDCSND